MRISLRRSKPVEDKINGPAREVLVQARKAAKRKRTGEEFAVVVDKQHDGADREELAARIKSLANIYSLEYVRHSDGTFTFTKI